MDNRLILIGNGFDRAHGLPTGYIDFMLWLFRKYVAAAITARLGFGDEFIHVAKNRYKTIQSADQFENLQQVQQCLLPGLTEEYVSQQRFAGYLAHINVKDHFVGVLLNNAVLGDPDWADIEKTYYRNLLAIVRNSGGNRQEKKKNIVKLNKALNFIKDSLADYLRTLPAPQVIPAYKKIIHGGANMHESFFLSFNYTKTHEAPAQTA